MKLGLISPSFPLISEDEQESQAFFLTDQNRKLASKVRDLLKRETAFGFEYDYSSNLFSAALPLIAGLTPDSFDIKMIDENREDINFSERFDLVGITAMTQQATKAYEIADEFRRKGVFVVIGGMHPTVLPKEAKEHADTVMVGEAENTWPVFMEDFLSGRTLPFYRETGVVDLERSPIPRFDLLKDKGYRMQVVQVSRGCPYDCEFCASSKVYGVRYRHKTVNQVIEEIEAIKDIWDTPFIYFADDDLFVHRDFAKRLLRAFIPLNIRWSAYAGSSVAWEDELLGLARESGCLWLSIGFESVTEDGLRSIGRWKLNQLKRYPAVVEKVQSYGIVVRGSFIVGFDGDDLSIFKGIEDFVISSNIYTINMGILTPFPGTRIREKFQREGRLLDTPWSNYNLVGVNYKPKLMTPLELQTGFVETFERLYERAWREKAKYFRKIYRDLYRLGRLARTA